MIVKVSMSHEEIRAVLTNHIAKVTGLSGINSKDLKLEVKSKMNYKSEWEEATTRIECDLRVE